MDDDHLELLELVQEIDVRLRRIEKTLDALLEPFRENEPLTLVQDPGQAGDSI